MGIERWRKPISCILGSGEYEDLLSKHNFKVLEHVVKDPDCGCATIWMAQYSS
jgi:hypothetical protein